MARMGDHDLRIGGVGPASVDAAHTARLSEHVFEAGYCSHARRRRGADQPDIANAGDHKIHRRQWPRICRSSVPLCMYHDRLRRGLRLSFSYCLRDDAKNGATRMPNTQYRLWRNGDRNDGCAYGDNRGVRIATRRILRNQHEGRAYGSGGKSMFNRAGGAPTFAVGMAHMFARISAGPTALALWYHFAIMFEALFILTTIDAGTRVGRFLLQDFLGNLWRPLGNTRSWSANLFSSVLLVSAWGWFLYEGVIDPLGGINSLWPLFGLANQLLSVVALCLGTTILIKMHKTKYVFVTLLPLVFMCAVTFSAGYLKVFSADPKLGFLSGARSFVAEAAGVVDPSKTAGLIRQAAVWRFDALVALFFLVLVLLIVLGSARQWWQLLRGSKRVVLHESEFVSISAAQLAEF